MRVTKSLLFSKLMVSVWQWQNLSNYWIYCSMTFDGFFDVNVWFNNWWFPVWIFIPFVTVFLLKMAKKSKRLLLKVHEERGWIWPIRFMMAVSPSTFGYIPSTFFWTICRNLLIKIMIFNKYKLIISNNVINGTKST